jgi:hypothetical protein
MVRIFFVAQKIEKLIKVYSHRAHLLLFCLLSHSFAVTYNIDTNYWGGATQTTIGLNNAYGKLTQNFTNLKAGQTLPMSLIARILRKQILII